MKVEPTWIALEDDERGNNFKAKVFIPNRSLVAFELVSLLDPTSFLSTAR